MSLQVDAFFQQHDPEVSAAALPGGSTVVVRFDGVTLFFKDENAAERCLMEALREVRSV